jgi:hypothetical protein
MDFVVAHRNIAMVLTFGESDNLISTPAANGRLGAAKTLQLIQWANASNSQARSVGTFAAPSRFGRFGRFGGFRRGQQQTSASTRPAPQRPDSTINRADVEYFRKVSEQYKEMTGISEAATTRAPRGAFFDYGYFQFGVPSFSTPGWGLPSASGRQSTDSTAVDEQPPARRRPGQGAPAGGQAGQGQRAAGGSSGESTDQRVLTWMDEDEIDGFVDWQAFDHPQLGAVEIGGFKPYVTTNPPADELDALGESHAEFAVYLMSLFARVRIAKTEVTSHGAGIFEVKAEVENTGFLPTAMQHGVRARAVPAVMVQLDVAPESVITGAAKTSLINSLNGSGAREEFVWLIRGDPGERVELRVRSAKSGLDSQTITLR